MHRHTFRLLTVAIVWETCRFIQRIFGGRTSNSDLAHDGHTFVGAYMSEFVTAGTDRPSTLGSDTEPLLSSDS